MESERYNDTKKVGIVGIVGNIFLVIIKMITGMAFKSQAMIADSICSASDVFSSVMTSIGNKIANIPKNKNYNLGYGKAEYIFSLFIAISMLLISVELFMTNIKNLIDKCYTIKFSMVLITSAIITIIVKLCMYLYTRKNLKKYNNMLLEANAKDQINDVMVSSFTLISAIFAKFNIYSIDSITGCGISIWVGICGINIIKDCCYVLMDKSINEETKNKIIEIAKSHKEVKNIDHLNCSPMGVIYMVSLSIFVDGNMKTYESHDIANKIEKEITKMDEVGLAIVHVNPI